MLPRFTAAHVIPLLTDASPSFAERWAEWLAFWADDQEVDDESGDLSAGPDNPRGYFNDVAQFAHYIVERFEHDDSSSFPAVFAVIEALLSDGDEYVNGLIVIGLIEDLQTISSNHPCGRDALRPWCGPIASGAWDQAIEMWRGNGNLADVIRAEQRSGDHETTDRQE